MPDTTNTSPAQPVLTDDQIEALAKKHIAPHAGRLDAIMTNPVPYQQTEQFRRVKALIVDVLSNLRAPVADERSVFNLAIEAAGKVIPAYGKRGDMIALYADQLAAVASLASAPNTIPTQDCIRWQAGAWDMTLTEVMVDGRRWYREDDPKLASAPVTHYECGRSNGDGTYEAVPVRAPIADETYTDENGTVWTRPTAWAYAQVCKARDKWQAAASAPVAGEAQEHYDEVKATLQGAHRIMEGVSAIERRAGPIGSHARGYTHKITNALRHLDALYAAPQASAEQLVRYCPGCGSIGPVEEKYRDCCPDGDEARMIPAALAEKCRDTFNIAVKAMLTDAAANDSTAPQASEAVSMEDLKAIAREVTADSAAIRAEERNAALEEAAGLLDDNRETWLVGRAAQEIRNQKSAPQAGKPDFADVYEGAREDLAIWKRRALEAERDLRAERETSSRLVAALNAENGPTHMGEPAPQASEADVPTMASSVINDACWKFVETMPHQLPGPVFNDLKPALYAAVCHVLAELRQRARTSIDLDAAAKALAERMDYPWVEMPEQGRAHMREHAQSVVNAALSGPPAPQTEAPRDDQWTPEQMAAIKGRGPAEPLKIPLVPFTYPVPDEVADPCPQCVSGAVCKKPTCGRLAASTQSTEDGGRNG
ncbi:MAG: hypothetical protein ACN6PJ_15665 [Achromobacter sp.]|uniref:hypothetical protein n=1 Tax=Achromobacter sp. TaxID=134375 RepID=UPI003D05A11F